MWVDFTAQSDVLACIVYAMPATEENIHDCTQWRRVSKKWKLVLDDLVRWDSSWMHSLWTQASVAAIARVRAPAVSGVHTVPDMLACMRTAVLWVQEMVEDTMNIKDHYGSLNYEALAGTHNECMRQVILVIDPALDEAGMQRLIASNVLDPILCYGDNLRGMFNDDEAWILFVRLLVREHTTIAAQIITRHSNVLQQRLLSSSVSLETFASVLRLEALVGARLFYDDSNSYLHWVCAQDAIPADVIEKLGVLASVYGPRVFTWIPARDVHHQSTLVTTYLEHGFNWFLPASPAQERALPYLIHVCPASQGVVSAGAAPNRRVCNAFSWVACHCTDASDPRLVMIAQMVMRYATTEDVRRVHNGKRLDRTTGARSADRTLLAMVVERQNRFVAQIIVDVFAPQLEPAEIALLRTLA